LDELKSAKIRATSKVIAGVRHEYLIRHGTKAVQTGFTDDFAAVVALGWLVLQNRAFST